MKDAFAHAPLHETGVIPWHISGREKTHGHMSNGGEVNAKAA
jgi:hypothetical protein